MVDIPDGLVEAQVEYNGARGREFLDALPALAAGFLERWELRRTGRAMHGMTALVLPVRRADGSAAVLKLVLPDEENAGEALALRAWDGHGCVRLLEHDEASGALLLERLDEGRPLSALARGDDRAAVRVVARLLGRLTRVPAPVGLRGLGEIAAGLLAGTPGAVAGLADAGERALVRDCAAALAEVAGEPGDRLLHWDLHFDNVLGAGVRTGGERGQWLAIDPKPLSGDPGFELLPAIVNRFRADEVVWRFELLAGELGLDRERARAWTLGRVLQNAVWDVADGESALGEEQAEVARLLLGRDLHRTA
ncbi:aminoglycoside phosphotransferase family protein [Streptomyces sp. NPDC059917]|uniref:aminoglycoside phosphotransferase family protein n=1 Tax=Streptomyces sp. NPDC059917 TaxID=3347002 RepID=UPI00364C95E2